MSEVLRHNRFAHKFGADLFEKETWGSMSAFPLLKTNMFEANPFYFSHPHVLTADTAKFEFIVLMENQSPGYLSDSRGTTWGLMPSLQPILLTAPAKQLPAPAVLELQLQGRLCA